MKMKKIIAASVAAAMLALCALPVGAQDATLNNDDQKTSTGETTLNLSEIQSYIVTYPNLIDAKVSPKIAKEIGNITTDSASSIKVTAMFGTNDMPDADATSYTANNGIALVSSSLASTISGSDLSAAHYTLIKDSEFTKEQNITCSSGNGLSLVAYLENVNTFNNKKITFTFSAE